MPKNSSSKQLASRRRSPFNSNDSRIRPNKYFKSGDAWFPETISYSRTVDGEIAMDERTVIRNARFNEGVESASFTLRGLGLAKGTTVLDENLPNASLEWDGEQLIQTGKAPPMP